MSERLQAWHEFYFLLGTSAAALTGLMFVVVAVVIGIHNAWDLVIWTAQRRKPEKTHK